MSWTAPSSPTGGLQPYRVEGMARRRPSADEAYLQILRLFQNRSEVEPQQELGKMDPIAEMIDALRKSIDEAITIDDAGKRTEALNKSFGEFGATLSKDVSVAMDLVAQETYMRGVTGKPLAKVDDADEPLQKGISHIASFAAALRSAESTVMSMVNDNYSRDQLSDNSKAAISAFIEFGAGVLRMLAMELGGGMEEVSDGADGVEKMDAPGPDDMAKLASDLQAAIARFSAEPLTKADGEEIDQMNPVEVMGRLAAAIVMMADQMIPGTDAGQAEGAAAAADGAAGVDESGAGREAPPAEGGDKAPPAEGGEEAPPAEGGDKAPPAADGGDPTKKEEDEEVNKSSSIDELAKLIDSKISAATEPLSKAISEKDAEIAALKKQISDAGKQPAPAKGAITAVTKSNDGGDLGKGDDVDSLAKSIAALPDKDRAEALIKVAFRSPGRAA